MGLEDYNNSGTVFLKLKHGHLCEDSKTAREGFDKVEGNLRDGTPFVKWIKPYRAVSGYIYKIDKYDREFNGRKFRGWNIHLDDGDFRAVLDIPFESRINSRWMKLAANIDFAKPVRFSAWQDRKTDTLAFNVQQMVDEDVWMSVPQLYTRDNMGECPEPVQRSSGKWDYGAQEDFLVERMENYVIPTVVAATAKRLGDKAPTAPEQQSEADETEPDERPKLLSEIKKNLEAAASQDNSSIPKEMEDFFGTRIWKQVEEMEISMLDAAARKLLDHVVPF